LPLFRDPLNALLIISVNLVKMPAVAVILLGPSAVALTFFFFVLAKPMPPVYNRKQFVNKILISCIFIFVAVLALATVAKRGSAQIVSEGLRYNCQLRAVMYFLSSDSGRRAKTDLANATRKIPDFDQIELALKPQRTNHNVVIVILEGIQYRYTSLADASGNLTPYLATLAGQGVEFANTRSASTHTTKVLFSLLTGRFPSASHDIAEAVPAVKPYASLATILKQNLNFRTAFFQSAKGNFEGRPGLVYSLGFDKFWARDDLNDPNDFLGYLACDEFSMLKPITEWIKADPVRDPKEKVSNGADTSPFFLTILCSVTHDPYEVPEWFATLAKEPLERYRQAISYTDKFVAALDVELAKLNLTDKTIFCVIGDHGEAFGEHGLLGHERIAFDEVLRIPFCLRAPFLVKPATTVTQAVSSVDLVPTLLALLGFDIEAAGFDGADALGHIPNDRKVYFSGWMRQSPAGFVKANRKFIYSPTNKMVSVYDLSVDPLELSRTELPEQQGQQIADEIIAWRKNSIFRLDQQRTGEKTLFDSWLCRWTNRVSSAKYYPQPKN
jgi:phosphoglycerol transferase MdoB-like AlkP superfamily enzyme